MTFPSQTRRDRFRHKTLPIMVSVCVIAGAQPVEASRQLARTM